MVKIFADGASIEEMQEVVRNPLVVGLTTNPSLMRKAGVTNYQSFAQRALYAFPNYPISFEVIADEFTEMERQAKIISSWGENVYVKIPVCNTKGESSAPLIGRLSADGIKVNATAILCYKQIDEVMEALGSTPAVISIFAGRIADTGRDPVPFITYALKQKRLTIHEVLWASPRQVLDVHTADSIGCDIITVTKDILNKLPLEGKSLLDYSRETVEMFYKDAQAAGYSL